jgi:sterol desaturase/sphingolipid hydroxylase (fatty acid hydroxylase superfamily)/CDGSH-type Zn-finger protein
MQYWFSILHEYEQFIVAGIILFFGLIEIIGGILKSGNRSKEDLVQEVVSFGLLSVVIKPGIVLLVFYLGSFFFPDAHLFLSKSSILVLLLVYLLTDDFLQYWYHRSAHRYEFLWKLHRPHHAAKEMGLLVSYRNAVLYYLMMPNIWWIALFTFLGGGIAVSVGLILKQVVIVSSHSTTKWDRLLYRFPFLSPITWIIERIIITPAFHFAHHGKSQADEISDPNGNFGNMFSFWDLMFGTAIFTRKYPSEFGLQTDTNDSWSAHVFYPLVKSKNPNSNISSEFKKEKSTTNLPIKITLASGNYLWCACGFSKTQPFCDGSHHGTTFKPKLLKVNQTKTYSLCNCKMSKLSPICDGSHKQL